MANIKSQIKRNKQNETARLRNKSVKSALKTALRKAREAVSAGDKAAAVTAAADANRALDKAWAYYLANQEESIRIMAAREGITPAEFAETLSGGIHLYSPAESAAFFESGGNLQAIAETTATYLRLMNVISNKSGVTDCSP